MKADAARAAALWWALDMAAPTFEHDADDGQAQLASAVVARRQRPPRATIMTFSQMLEDYLLVAEDKEIVLEVAFTPLGEFNLLCDRAKLGGSKVHLLSWNTKMWVSDDKVTVRQGPRGNKRVIFKAE